MYIHLVNLYTTCTFYAFSNPVAYYYVLSSFFLGFSVCTFSAVVAVITDFFAFAVPLSHVFFFFISSFFFFFLSFCLTASFFFSYSPSRTRTSKYKQKNKLFFFFLSRKDKIEKIKKKKKLTLGGSTGRLFRRVHRPKNKKNCSFSLFLNSGKTEALFCVLYFLFVSSFFLADVDIG